MRLHSVLRDGILRLKTSAQATAHLKPNTIIKTCSSNNTAFVTHFEKNYVYALPLDFDPTNLDKEEFEIHDDDDDDDATYSYADLRGRIVDPLARPLDGGRYINKRTKTKSTTTTTHSNIVEPLQTSIRYVDALYPIGKGHRVAIVGEASTNKRTIARAIASSPDTDLTVYLAFGRSRSVTAKTIRSLNRRENMILVATTPEDPIGMQVVAFDMVSRIAQEAQQDGLSVSLVVDEMSHYVDLQKRLHNIIPIPAVRASQILEIASQLSPSNGSGSLTVTCVEDVQDPILSASSTSISDGLRSSADVFLSTPARLKETPSTSSSMPPFQSLANSYLSDQIKTKLSSTADVADVADHASRFDISAFEEGREDEMKALMYRNGLSTLLVGPHNDVIEDEDPARTLLSLVIATLDQGELLVRLASSKEMTGGSQRESNNSILRFESKAWFELQSRSALLNHSRSLALATAARPMRWEDRQSSMYVLLEPLEKLIRDLERDLDGDGV